MSTRKRSHKMEKLARIYDAEILPVWSQRFGRMLLRDLEIPPGGQVLDVACGTGYPAIEIIRRLPEGSRLIAIDGSSAMLDIARKKVEDMGAKGVFFRTESALPRLSFADDVYDVVVCNLGLGDFTNPERALIDFARVTRPGGEVRCSLPIAGTFAEFYDIFHEVLVKHDKHDILRRLTEHMETSYYQVSTCEEWMEAAGLERARVEVEEFKMLFRSSREFFFAPVIEYGPLPQWKAIAGTGREMQDIFWYIKEAIDAYFGDRAFEVTVRAGCLVGTVVEPPDLSEVAEEAPEEEEEDLSQTLDRLKPVLQIDDDVELEAFLDESERSDQTEVDDSDDDTDSDPGDEPTGVR